MAEQLEEFNFGRMRSGGNGTYASYMEIEDGESEGPIWKLSPEDSPSGTANIRSMQTTAANIARSLGVKLRTNVIEENGDVFLVLQAYVAEEE